MPVQAAASSKRGKAESDVRFPIELRAGYDNDILPLYLGKCATKQGSIPPSLLRFSYS